ncbi:MAG: hypothetical protein JXQ75_15160 [Phycisphaerae bacterium]|nr:hypothetical protein [Phycisphaerae bacterium]
MQLVAVRSKRRLAVLLAAVIVAGCSSADWRDWWNKDAKNTQTKPEARVDRPTHQPKTVKVESKPDDRADDPKAREVNAELERYTRKMENDDQDTYALDGINAKIRRQQSPDRRRRIRSVAEDTRADPTVHPATAGEEPQVRTAAATEEPSVRTAAASERPATRTPAAFEEPEIDTATAGEKPTVPAARDDDTAPSQAGLPGAASTEPHRPATERTNAPSALAADGAAEMPHVAANVRTDNKGDASRTSDEVPASTEPPARPPVLSKIEVSAGPEPSTAAPRATEDTRPSANVTTPAGAQTDTFQQRLDEFKARVEEEPDDIEDQYRLRMMYLLDGEEDKALAPVDGGNAEIQEMIQAHFQALIAAQSSPGRDPAENANHQLERIEELRSVVRARADLMVPKVVLCTAIEGFGRYTPIEPAEFQGGQKNRVLLYIEVDNFRCETTPSGMYRTLLSVRQSLLTKSGEELWSTHDDNIEDIARQRRRDFYLTVGPLMIPKTLGAGEYVLKVEVEDVLAGKINSNVAKFRIVP